MVHMREAVPFRNHLCISFELLSINLYDYIKANQFKGSSLRLIRSAFTHPDFLLPTVIHLMQTVHATTWPLAKPVPAI